MSSIYIKIMKIKPDVAAAFVNPPADFPLSPCTQVPLKENMLYDYVYFFIKTFEPYDQMKEHISSASLLLKPGGLLYALYKGADTLSFMRNKLWDLSIHVGFHPNFQGVFRRNWTVIQMAPLSLSRPFFRLLFSPQKDVLSVNGILSLNGMFSIYPPHKQDRIHAVLTFLQKHYPQYKESLPPAFDKLYPIFSTKDGSRYVSIASRKQYVSLYFTCLYSAKLIASTDRRILCTLGWVKIPDNIPFPISSIEKAIVHCFHPSSST